MWLKDLELSEYTELFHSEGYNTGEDVINLKDLDEEQLRAMGVTKKGASTINMWATCYYTNLFSLQLTSSV